MVCSLPVSLSLCVYTYIYVCVYIYVDIHTYMWTCILLLVLTWLFRCILNILRSFVLPMRGLRVYSCMRYNLRRRWFLSIIIPGICNKSPNYNLNVANHQICTNTWQDAMKPRIIKFIDTSRASLMAQQ